MFSPIGHCRCCLHACLSWSFTPPPSYPPSLWAVLLAALYHPFQPKFRLVGLLCFRLVSRRCHIIPALPRLSVTCGTMRVLTPARVRFPCRHPRLRRTAFPTFRPQTHHDARPSLASPCSTGPVVSRLRHESAGSPRHTAESGSSSYGLPVRLRLLPTPPRGDAVTFGFGGMAYSGADFHRADGAPSRAHGFPRVGLVYDPAPRNRRNPSGTLRRSLNRDEGPRAACPPCAIAPPLRLDNGAELSCPK